MKEINNADEMQFGDIVLEIYSETCIPCKKQLKVLDTIELSGKLPNVTFLKCNSGSELGGKLCKKYDLISAPSILCLRENSLLHKFSGFTLPNDIINIF